MAQTRGTFDALYDNVDKAFYSIMKDQLKELPGSTPSTSTSAPRTASSSAS
jgi:hypothetical protein